MDLVRESALKVVFNVLAKGAYANIALNKELKRNTFSPLERRFLTELAYGTIRSHNTLNWILEKFSKKRKIDTWIKHILFLGIYQIFYMDKVPDSAACNESVELAKKYVGKGSSKFVNGVLRNIVRKRDEIEYPSKEVDPVSYISLKYSHPVWMVKRWIKQFGFEDTVKLCQYNNTPGPLALRTNTIKNSRDYLQSLLEEEGIKTQKSNYTPEGLVVISLAVNLSESSAFTGGRFFIQNDASQLVSRILAPRKNCFIIDGCAAPGGKTTHLAQLVENDADIVACDIYGHKIKLVKDNCERLGITCVETKKIDARELHKIYLNKADFLLLDVPCSGMGVLKKPDTRWKKKEQDIIKISSLQKEIIKNASQCLKKEGVLVYSTCSINPEENLDVIKYFLQNSPFKLESLLPYLPDEVIKDSKDMEDAHQGYLQLLPQKHNCDGFFIARLRKY